MESLHQSERETYRVIVINRDGTEILLKNSDGGFMLPPVEIPRCQRIAENLTAVVKQQLGCDAVCLFTGICRAQDDTCDPGRYETMECWREDRCADGTVWKAIGSLGPNSFLHPDEYKMMEYSVHELLAYERDPSSPFAGRGWLRELRNWTSRIIRPLGLELTSSFRQYNASPAFNLTRFETTGSAVWFKAVGEPNLREFPVTLKLAELSPKFIPEILGTKPEWNGWLSREVEGIMLGDAQNLALWEQAAADLARLQIESILESESILKLGAHDLLFAALLSAVGPFFDVVMRLMDEQPSAPPSILSRDELDRLAKRIEDALVMLEGLRIPSALGHLDLNSGNIIVSRRGCVFLDWAEAYVGSPFFSFEYLRQHFQREMGPCLAFESRVALAYTAEWRQLVAQDSIDKALVLARLSAIYAYAVGTEAWKDDERMKEAVTAGYFRSLARRMNREAIAVSDQRSPCLS
jgi:hypothetical protein